MTVIETVYAIQNFVAENEDELSFQVGEPIIIIQKDDGFNDGWWKGENMHGEVGLFPMSYVTYEGKSPSCHQRRLAQLPTPSSSDVVMTKETTAPIDLTDLFSNFNEQNDESRFSLGQSSYSFTCPMGPTTSAATAVLSNQLGGSSNIAIRRLVIKALFLPALRSTPPEEWNVNQVVIWLTAMNFQSIADNFKSQEITGDILLELNMGSLKELDVPTFGKRYKLHTAIRLLRTECGLKNQPKRVSVCSPTCFDNYLQNDNENELSTQNLNNTRKGNTEHNRRHNHRKSFYSGSGKEDYCEDGDAYQSSQSSYPNSSASPLTPTSTVDLSDLQQNSYFEHLNGDEDLFLSSENSNMYTMHQGQYNQAIYPGNSRSTLDIYYHDDTENVAPDMEGWLFKQGCKYKKWNKRWFVLKGPNLFYFKSPKDVRMKGIINLRGYKIVVDETIQPGKYSFKAQHEEERTFFFYTDMEQDMRAWISSLIKATISRDFAAPVLSSSIIPTVSLEVARRMRPRPPSVLLHRKGGATVSKSSPTHSSMKKARKSMTVTSNLSESSHHLHAHNRAPLPTINKSSSSIPSTASTVSTTHTVGTTTSSYITEEVPLSESDENAVVRHDGDADANDSRTLTLLEALSETSEEEKGQLLHHFQEQKELEVQTGYDILNEEEVNQKTLIDASSWSVKDYITWVNTFYTRAKIMSLKEIRQGEVLEEILQNISGKQVNQRTAASSPSLSSLAPKGTASVRMLDSLVNAFEFMGAEGVAVDHQLNVKDIYSGNEEKIMLLLKSIIQWSTRLQSQDC